MNVHWMRALSAHYERTSQLLGDARLALATDIDGTILDMRHMILGVLLRYDRDHRTRYFERLTSDAIDVHENQVEWLLERLHVPETARRAVMEYYLRNRWSEEAVCEMHRPFEGVLEMIRWFQLQPRTRVALLTGRPEKLRSDTLRSLNQLGARYRVQFSDELLFMNPGEWEQGVADAKVVGIQRLRAAGYHPFAFIDNEPANLRAVGGADPDRHLLLLHADTIFESKRVRVPRGSVRGREYRLEELIPREHALSSPVQLVWHGVNDPANLRQFLASDVRWAEVDARLEPGHAEVVLRGDSFAQTPARVDERWLSLPEVLHAVRRHGRGIKIDLKSGDGLLEQVLSDIAATDMPDTDLWFNGRIEFLQAKGFRAICAAHPGAIVQCPADWVVPLLGAAPDKAYDVLEMLRSWGIRRFSFSWEHAALHEVVSQVERWGYEVNVYNVPDLESFLRAVLLLPNSVTSAFNFPRWNYFGRGPGKRGEFHNYEIHGGEPSRHRRR